MLDKAKAVLSVITILAIWVAGFMLLVAIGRLTDLLPPGTSDVLCVGIFILWVIFMLPSMLDEVKASGYLNPLPWLGLLLVVLLLFGFANLVNYLVSQVSAWFQRLPLVIRQYCCGGVILLLVVIFALLSYWGNKGGGGWQDYDPNDEPY